MDVLAVVRALNQKAADAKSYHFCDPTLAFSDPIYTRFLSLWQSKAGARAMPAKSEISPRDLKEFLGNIVLCHRVTQKPSCFIWRLVGTRVAAVFGDVVGKTFAESLIKVLSTRKPDAMPIIRYDVKPARGPYQVKYWAITNIPILGADGYVRWILNHAEDVTELTELRARNVSGQ
jgi:hypothetical protein